MLQSGTNFHTRYSLRIWRSDSLLPFIYSMDLALPIFIDQEIQVNEAGSPHPTEVLDTPST